MGKKFTITMKMSLRDYAKLAYYLETGDFFEPDFSQCDKNALKEVKKYTMRVTQETKEQINKFFDRFPLGISADSILDSIPRKQEV